jgi:histidyl-tRNA synthetase
VSEVLGRLRFEDFVIRINDRRLLTALLDCAGVAGMLHGEALVALDKLDKIGVDGVERELLQRGIAAEATCQALAMFAGPVVDREDNDARLSQLGQIVAAHPQGTEAVASLRHLLTLTEGTAARAHIRVDPSLARGLSYYTGAIMEISVADLPGSLGGGGRYDNLVGMFLGRDVPACGFSLGLERIIVVMQEREMFPAKVSRGAVDVMVACLAETLRPEAMRLSSELRGQALRVEMYPDAGRKLEKPLKYAASRGVPVMVILGEDEQAQGRVTVRDLDTREQTSVIRDGAAAEIARRVRLSDET